jgi:hypothetical protein
MGRLWIGRVDFDPAISNKIKTKHDLTEAEVIEAVAFGRHVRAAWDEDPRYGRRLVVLGRTAADREVVAYLRPVDENDGHWECRTAIRTDGA